MLLLLSHGQPSKKRGRRPGLLLVLLVLVISGGAQVLSQPTFWSPAWWNVGYAQHKQPAADVPRPIELQSRIVDSLVAGAALDESTPPGAASKILCYYDHCGGPGPP